MPTPYAAVFAELKEALRPFRRELLQPTEGETSRLRDAVRAARELVEKDRLRTRAQAVDHGALRRGAQYLEERDLTNLTKAEELLRVLP